MRIAARIVTTAVSASLVFGFVVLPANAAEEQPASSAAASGVSGAGHLTAEEFSAQSRRVLHRTPRRVPVYRSSTYPGPNSVRVCNAWLAQEYRPSGTVIVPLMHCEWRG